MHWVIYLASLVTLSCALPQRGLYNQQGYYNPNIYVNSRQATVPIISQTQDQGPDGSYSFSYATADGQQRQETGIVKNYGLKELGGLGVQGSYSYVSPEGIPISVRYTADENGFHAEGDNLPTPPPIPPEIQESLNLIARTQNVAIQPHYLQGAARYYQPQPNQIYQQYQPQNRYYNQANRQY